MKHIILAAFIFTLTGCVQTPVMDSPIDEKRLCEPNNIFLIPDADIAPPPAIELSEDPTRQELLAALIVQRKYINEMLKVLRGF